MIGLGAALGWINFPSAFADGYIRSALQYHNATAIYLAASFLLGLGLVHTMYKRWQVSLLLSGCLLLGVTILGTLSRASWMLTLVFLALYVAVIPSGNRLRALRLTGMLLISILVVGRVVQNAYLAEESWIAFLVLLAGGAAVSLLGTTITYCRPKPVNQGKTSKREKADPDKVPSKAARTMLLAGGTLLLLVIFVGGIVKYPAASSLDFLFPDRVIARADQTFTDNTSQAERMVSYRDGLKIVRDYPLTGTGGGGWAALYHSYADQTYFVNEMHNYYLKVTIETGIPGLLTVAAIGIFFLCLLFKRRQTMLAHPDCPLILAEALAAIVIAVHAGMDFDLSIPAIALTLFALMGAVRGKLIADPQQKSNKGSGSPLNIRVQGVKVVGILAALVITILAGRMYAGILLGNKGAEALTQKELNLASGYYQQAAKADPWSAQYLANLARTAALQAVQQQDQAGCENSLDYAGRAARLSTGQPDLMASLFTTYGLLGRKDLQVEAAGRAIENNPFAPEPYRMLASTGLAAAWQCLDRGKNTEADWYLSRILEARKQLPPYLESKIPDLELAAGQAALLKANTALAGQYLKPITLYKGNTGKTARAWMTGAERMQVQINSVPTLKYNQTLYLKQLQQILVQEFQNGARQ
ncbi:MAG: O-antigen ligase family protein [Methylocystaceae bacterium]